MSGSTVSLPWDDFGCAVGDTVPPPTCPAATTAVPSAGQCPRDGVGWRRSTFAVYQPCTQGHAFFAAATLQGHSMVRAGEQAQNCTFVGEIPCVSPQPCTPLTASPTSLADDVHRQRGKGECLPAPCSGLHSILCSAPGAPWLPRGAPGVVVEKCWVLCCR